jgi:hypothetical protein
VFALKPTTEITSCKSGERYINYHLKKDVYRYH